MKIKKTSAVLLTLALLFSLLPFDFLCQFKFKNSTKATGDTVIIEENTTWNTGSAPSLIDNTDYIFKGDLTIEPGVKIIFRNNSRIIVEGIFNAVGNENSPIIFEGEAEVSHEANYAINLRGGESDINVISNVIFKKGGGNQCFAYEKNNWFKEAWAEECVPQAALNINLEKGSFAINNTQFLENYHGLNVFKGGGSSYVRESIFANNWQAAIYSREQSGIDASQNCWMRPSGPTHPDNPAGGGELIVAEAINYYPWKTCGTEHPPVIILPGIGGSWNWERMFEEGILSNDWDFSPGNHHYDGLVEAFKDQGYEKGEDLQIVHYDWRQDNSQSVEEFLMPVMEELKKKSFDKNYSIIAHSMGGLVALDYIYSSKYQDNIDKLVLLGTPVFGASKVYPVWEGGVLPKDWQPLNIYLWALSLKDENEGKDYYDLIHEYTPSAKQLMPIYDYVIKNENQEMVSSRKMQEQNDYIPGLLQRIIQYSDNFNGSDILLVEGSGVETSKEVFVDEYNGENNDKLWKDGQPNPYPLKKENLAGDGTVLNESSDLYFINGVGQQTTNETKHTQLPVKTIPEVYSFLGLDQPSETYALATENQRIFVLACPVDVKIIAPDKKFITKEENQIENAYYYSDGRRDGYKIIEIQDSLDGQYELELTGNGDGEYAGFIYDTNGENYKEVEIEGTITENDKISLLVEENEEELIIEEKEQDTEPPVVEINSPGEREYLSDEKIEIDYSVSDNKTAQKDLTKEEFLDEEVFAENEIDLAFQLTGGHNFKVKAEDKAGNQGEAEIEFEVVADYGSLISNLKIYKNLDWITRREYRFFKIQLKYLERLDSFFENHRKIFFYWRYRKRLERVFDRIIDRRLRNLIWLVERRIDHPDARELIVDRMEFIRENR